MDITQIDKYLGEVAKAEKAQYTKTAADNQQMLTNIIKRNPFRIEAYLKLWLSHYKKKNFEQCLSISEKALQTINSNDKETACIIVFVHAKSLVKNKKELKTLQLYQQHYLIHSEYPIFLFHYGKCIVKAEDEDIKKKYLGVSVSFFQECLRSCVKYRYGVVYYWMGRAYELRKDLPNSLFCYGRVKEFITNKPPKQILNYINTYKEFQTNANIVSDQIKESRKGKTKIEDIAFQKRLQEKTKAALQMVKKQDTMYAQYLKLLYTFYVNNDIEKTKKLIKSIDKTLTSGLYCLIEIWNIERALKNYEQMISIAKYIYKLLDSFEVPNDNWVKGHIICAKTLICNKENCVGAIRLLKEVYPLIPTLPLLKRSISICKDLDSDYTSRDYSFTDSFIRTDEEEKFNSSLRKSKTEVHMRTSSHIVTSTLIDNLPELEPPLHRTHIRRCEIYAKPKTYTQSTRFDTESTMHSLRPSYLTTNLDIHSPNPIEENMENELELFSVSTQWEYLYTLGRIAIKYDVDIELGIRALSNLIGLLDYLSIDKPLAKYKAKYWIAYGLYEIEGVNEASIILKELLKVNNEKLKRKVEELLGKCHLNVI